ncbi:MAG: prolipoprotein diacylglyceryl transferase [Lachnospiraceae bacterium]|nr:prolipoprotein diacylglyceryl transferase [Lachnospiraceae bacterium]
MNYNINFPNLNIHLDHVGQEISIGSFSIAYYGIVIALGMVLAIMCIIYRAKRCGDNDEDFLDVTIWTIIFGVIGARLYYVIFSWDYYSQNLADIINLRNGGLGIYGGILAGIIAAYIGCKKKNIRFLHFADVVIPGVLIGQIMGRWGNFFNREAFGQYTDGLFAMQLPVNAVRSRSDITVEMLAHAASINGDSYIQVHPTFLYESCFNIAVLILILFLSKRVKFDGELFFIYMFMYGAGRFFIEGLRTDQLTIGATGIAISQVVAVAMMVAAITLSAYQIKLKNKQNRH